jgi:amidase
MAIAYLKQSTASPLLIGPKDAPTSKYTPNQTSPVTGLPAFIVPAGFTPAGLPIGLEILGRPWTEPKLLRLAAGFEEIKAAHFVEQSGAAYP